MNIELRPDPLAVQQPCRRYGIDEAIHPVQIAAYRRMTPGRKLELMAEMYHAAIRFKMAALKMRHPEWTEEQLRREAQRISTYGVA